MSVTFYCRCGRRIVASPGEEVECIGCGRTVVVARQRNDNSKLWLLAAIGLTLLALAGLGVLLASARREKSRDETVQAGPPASKQISSPEPRANPIRKYTDLPDDWMVADTVTGVTVVAPPPREVITPEPVVIVAPPPRVRADRIETVFIEPPGRYKVGSTFGQEIVISRRSAFSIGGIDYGQASQYAFASSLVVTKVNRDGSIVVTQTIVNVKLIDADADSRAPLAAALEKAKGTQFELTISPTGSVTSLTGLKDPIQVQAGKNAGAESLRIWSLLDADAWKEMAAITFFQPEKPLKAGETWNRGESHDWGPLGSWRGKTIYAVAAKPNAKTALERIDYKHDIYYRPPAPGTDANLPIRIVKSDFRTVVAGGAIAYDATSHRATAAEETFRVRGAMLVSLGGLEAGVEMEELQAFKLTVTEQVPRELVAPGVRPK